MKVKVLTIKGKTDKFNFMKYKNSFIKWKHKTSKKIQYNLYKINKSPIN